MEPKLKDKFLPGAKALDDSKKTLLDGLSHALSGLASPTSPPNFTTGLTQAAVTLEQNLTRSLTAGMNATASALNTNARELQALAASLASGFENLSNAIAAQQQALSDIAAKMAEKENPNAQ